MKEDLFNVSKLDGDDIYLMKTALAVKISLLEEELININN